MEADEDWGDVSAANSLLCQLPQKGRHVTEQWQVKNKSSC